MLLTNAGVDELLDRPWLEVRKDLKRIAAPFGKPGAAERAINCLSRTIPRGADPQPTVRDVLAMDDDEMLAIRNFGAGSLRVVNLAFRDGRGVHGPPSPYSKAFRKSALAARSEAAMERHRLKDSLAYKYRVEKAKCVMDMRRSGMTLEQCGKEMNLSRERIRQIELWAKANGI